MPTLDEVIDKMCAAVPAEGLVFRDGMRAALLAAQEMGAVLVPEKATELMEDTAFVAMGNVSFNKHEQAGIIHRYLVAASPYRVKADDQN